MRVALVRGSMSSLLLLILLSIACSPPVALERPATVGVGEPTTDGADPAIASRPVASGWSGFRGPTGDGRSDQRLPERLDKNAAAWTIELPGAGASSPITIGDRAYVTCYAGYRVPGEGDGDLADLERRLIAIDLNDGSIVWTRSIPAVQPEEERIRDHGYAASTPAADDERVYVFYGKSGVLAFDHDGNRQWTTTVGGGTHEWGSGTSPVLVDELVIVNASVESGSLVALDRRTGEEVWKVGEIVESWNTPVLVTAADGRRELVLAVQGEVRAYDPASGRQLWNCATDIGWYMVPSIVAENGIVLCLGGRSGTAALAIRTGGSGDVTASHRLWTSNKGSNVTSPVVRDGHLYWMSDSQEIAFCARVSDGELLYQERVSRIDQVYASAILCGDRILYVGRTGKGRIVAAEPSYEELAEFDLSDRGVFDASPAIADGRLLIRSDRHLYCFATGR